MSLIKPLSKKAKNEIDTNPYYKKCARRKDGSCAGRITIEHAAYYAGKRIDDIWSLIPLCEYHHSVNRHQDGKGLDKNKNLWIALNRATDEELNRYDRADFIKKRELLNKMYG